MRIEGVTAAFRVSDQQQPVLHCFRDTATSRLKITTFLDPLPLTISNLWTMNILQKLSPGLSINEYFLITCFDMCDLFCFDTLPVRAGQTYGQTC